MVCSTTVFANDKPSKEQIFQERLSLYKQYENVLVPWYWLAAVDQYERNIQTVRSDIPKRDGITAIQFAPEYWVGELNPNIEDENPASIQYFGGFGLDGNGDGVASSQQDEDALLSLASYVSSFGTTEEDFELALWSYYKSEEAVKQISTISKLYEHFKTINLDKHYFPLPLNYDYSYRGTWGANRGWGGRRIHEGTDLFARYGTQVYSTSYGVIEIMGWNDYGGWRIGIRDHLNTYHYYAHLNSFHEGVKLGDIVEPGTLIGYVGSSGYGKEGTSGKFAPHLHYGMYKFNGRVEWAFDPYPSLQLWEKQTKALKE
ncbi:MAG: M23 family metallopeptidase [Solibacillus sp.]|jgi:peptidoglycan LD-endopeptidase LytH|uniref:M23 family metallopeptidase n=1 Tax=unclassified Solibacillus TaxID=2637870 RepID=UPI0030F857E1